MNPKALFARKLVFSFMISCCATVAVMGSASAAENPDGYITDSLVGQSDAQTADGDRPGGKHEGRTRSEVQFQQGAQQNYERVHGDGGSQPQDAVLSDDSSGLEDEIMLAGGLLLAFLMGIASALSFAFYTQRTA